MARPNRGQVKVDTLLSNLSIGYMQKQDVFIFPKVFAPVKVDEQSNKYIVYSSKDWNTDEAEVRKDSTESAGSGYDLSNDNYNCVPYSFHKDVGDQIIANAGGRFDLIKEAVEFVTRKILIKQEKIFAEKYLVSGVWGETLVGGTDFDQISEPTSSPIELFKGEIVSMAETTGIEPNTLVLGYKVFNDLSLHPDVIDRIKYTSADAPTEKILANLLGVQRVLVAKSVIATGKGATKTNAFAAGRNALLCYASPTPGVLAPSAGYTFSWNYAGIGPIGVKKFYIEEKETTRVEASSAFDCKITANELGKLLTLVTAA